MIEKLKAIGFEVEILEGTTSIGGRMLLRKKDFGWGWELSLPYVSVQEHLVKKVDSKNFISTLHKVTGEQKDLIFKIPGSISDEILFQIILNCTTI